MLLSLPLNLAFLLSLPPLSASLFFLSKELIGGEPSLSKTEGGLRLPLLDLPSWFFSELHLLNTDAVSSLAPDEFALLFFSEFLPSPLKHTL
ncbi:hypothetical protein Bca52824_081510 [Brassica carinata]|uniref:Secreted protein n=1 Tax=Brassica carinata TaxID=52824 RepID=A0A8X7PFC1_BRACI|nr:hypothetical protein Bca52824_081510 [Brassica carinata]